MNTLATFNVWVPCAATCGSCEFNMDLTHSSIMTYHTQKITVPHLIDGKKDFLIEQLWTEIWANKAWKLTVGHPVATFFSILIGLLTVHFDRFRLRGLPVGAVLVDSTHLHAHLYWLGKSVPEILPRLQFTRLRKITELLKTIFWTRLSTTLDSNRFLAQSTTIP